MVAPSDDMKAGQRRRGERKYFEVGRSAIELITDAMMLARRTQFPASSISPAAAAASRVIW
jgi:hypothetical protein